MFEQWPENRRRWFLVTFCAFTWLLFANSLAQLGDSFLGGGIGPDAAHASGVIGSIGGWVVLWAMFKLPMRHWLFAFLFGLSVVTALVEFGIRDHAAAGIWAAACEDGNSAACENLARWYGSGSTVLGGGLDQARLSRRACELGASDACRHVEVLENSDELQCGQGIGPACLRIAREYEAAGDVQRAQDYFLLSCREVGTARYLPACLEVLDGGIHADRLEACDTIEEVCSTSSDEACAVATRRCDRARAPHAGTDR